MTKRLTPERRAEIEPRPLSNPDREYIIEAIADHPPVWIWSGLYAALLYTEQRLRAVEQERNAYKGAYRIWFGYDDEGGFGNALSEATYKIALLEQENRTLREGLEAAKVIADSCFEGHDWHGLQNLIEAINDGIRDTLARAGGGADA